ncbi:hypothetical protein ILYODFUR_030074 [Ilyodon furcidens]|uniref:Uncharacterized protein n=1 Tax=Ilyodon furcidens TaxID=33524 RepID=A0ABV0VJZ3_9TELE
MMSLIASLDAALYGRQRRPGPALNLDLDVMMESDAALLPAGCGSAQRSHCNQLDSTGSPFCPIFGRVVKAMVP